MKKFNPISVSSKFAICGIPFEYETPLIQFDPMGQSILAWLVVNYKKLDSAVRLYIDSRTEEEGTYTNIGYVELNGDGQEYVWVDVRAEAQQLRFRAREPGADVQLISIILKAIITAGDSR